MNIRQSHYLISVSRITGTHDTTKEKHVHTAQHFFDVVVIGLENADKVYADICEKYKHEIDGYCVRMTYWDIKGTPVNSNNEI